MEFLRQLILKLPIYFSLLISFNFFQLKVNSEQNVIIENSSENINNEKLIKFEDEIKEDKIFKKEKDLKKIRFIKKISSIKNEKIKNSLNELTKLFKQR